MSGFCSNIHYDTISVTQPNQLVNQITICDSSKYNLEEISFKYYNMNKNAKIEYIIESEVFTKTERNLENMNNKYYKTYDSIIANDKKVILLKPIVFLIEQNKTGYLFTNAELNITAGGDNFEDAEENMYEEFVVQWDIYANEDDTNLTSKSLEIKNKLRETIKL